MIVSNLSQRPLGFLKFSLFILTVFTANEVLAKTIGTRYTEVQVVTGQIPERTPITGYICCEHDNFGSRFQTWDGEIVRLKIKLKKDESISFYDSKQKQDITVMCDKSSVGRCENNESLFYFGYTMRPAIGVNVRFYCSSSETTNLMGGGANPIIVGVAVNKGHVQIDDASEVGEPCGNKSND